MTRPLESGPAVRETLRVVGIGEKLVSRRSEDVLVTFSLGSCLGVVLYDPIRRIAGLIHCLLPLSRIDPVTAAASPETFVDTGLVLLLQAMVRTGAKRQDLVAWLAGASSVLDDAGYFRIGRRNYEVGRLVLQKNSIEIAGESIGGTAARTLRCRVADGRVTVRTGREEKVL